METTENTIQPEPVVERIVHAPTAPAEPVPPVNGTDAQKPEPAATDETAEATAAETTEQSEEHKQSKFQRRLDRQKAARYQAEAQANVLREERDRLRAQLDGQSRQQQDTGEPQRDQFADYEAYLRAVTRWDADQVTDKRLKAEQAERQGRERQREGQAEHEKLAKSWIEREKAFKATAQGYDETVNEFLDEGGEKLSPDSRALIIESELGPQLLHHLAVNPDEAERIAELSPRRQLIELGKLEDKLPKVNGKKTTNAPPPASTVRQGANSADGLRENMTQSEVASYMRTHGSRWVR